MPRKTETQNAAEGIVTSKKFALTPIDIVLTILFLGAVAAAGYFYYELKWAGQLGKEQETENLTEIIGAFIELPSDETPTLATVTDREKLADQAFFAKAENGDKVIIYSQSGKAILYRPSTKKIIEMTTISVTNPVQTDGNTEAQAPKETEAVPEAPAIVRVALRNGSETVGITNAAESKLKTILPNMAVTSKENAAKKDYTATVVVDLTGANTESAQKIAQELGGTVGNLPEGETAPTDADVVVIMADPSSGETSNE